MSGFYAVSLQEIVDCAFCMKHDLLNKPQGRFDFCLLEIEVYCVEKVHTQRHFEKNIEKYVFKQFSSHDPGYRFVTKSGYLNYKAKC